MLCLLLISRKAKQKRKGEKVRGHFSNPQQTLPAGYAALGFSMLIGAIKSCFKGQSLNFMCT
jgi:hypothetical protein